MGGRNFFQSLCGAFMDTLQYSQYSPYIHYIHYSQYRQYCQYSKYSFRPWFVLLGHCFLLKSLYKLLLLRVGRTLAGTAATTGETGHSQMASRPPLPSTFLTSSCWKVLETALKQSTPKHLQNFSVKWRTARPRGGGGVHLDRAEAKLDGGHQDLRSGPHYSQYTQHSSS